MWALAVEVYRACTCTEGRELGCYLRQSGLSSLTSHTTCPRDSLGQQGRGAVKMPPQKRAATCGAF